MQDKDIKTLGIVLRRTNYGEADRILNILTPEGKISVMARGVRKARSKLAGGVEMLTLSEINAHFKNEDMGILTGARMVRHYGGILKDLRTLEMASGLIKRIGAIAETSDAKELFEILKQGLEALEMGANAKLVMSWCYLNLAKTIGEEVNLYRDKNGEKLMAEKRYNWSVAEAGFEAEAQGGCGVYGATEIKMLRLMVSLPLAAVLRIKVDKELLGKIGDFARMFEDV